MKAEIIAIGTELLWGRVIDTNTGYLGRKLQQTGVSVARAHIVADDLEAIRSAIQESLGRADLVITIGGLGPTSDDLTREAISEVLDVPLIFREDLKEKIEAHFKKRNVPMPEINLRQAYLPEGAMPIENRVGTAPGFILEKGEKTICALPGPPNELIPMVEETLLPYVRGKVKGNVILQKVLRVVGKPESVVEEILQGIMTPTGNPTVTPLAKPYEIQVAITAEGDEETTKRLIEETERKIRERLGEDIFGTDQEELEEVVGRMLKERKMSLSVAESCTGGLLGYRITKVSGSSGYFMGGVISYSNEAKGKILGVSGENLERYGAVSEEVAKEMAEGVRRLFCTDLGIGITGIAGPTGGTPEKPVGLVYIALATPTGTICQRNIFPGDRESVRWRSSQTALDMLRRWLLRNPKP